MTVEKKIIADLWIIVSFSKGERNVLLGKADTVKGDWSLAHQWAIDLFDYSPKH
jgi:hypothetical protein